VRSVTATQVSCTCLMYTTHIIAINPIKNHSTDIYSSNTTQSYYRQPLCWEPRHVAHAARWQAGHCWIDLVITVQVTHTRQHHRKAMYNRTGRQALSTLDNSPRHTYNDNNTVPLALIFTVLSRWTVATKNLTATRRLYCVECPQYSIRLEAPGYLYARCLIPAFGAASVMWLNSRSSLAACSSLI